MNSKEETENSGSRYQYIVIEKPKLFRFTDKYQPPINPHNHGEITGILYSSTLNLIEFTNYISNYKRDHTVWQLVANIKPVKSEVELL